MVNRRVDSKQALSNHIRYRILFSVGFFNGLKMAFPVRIGDGQQDCDEQQDDYRKYRRFTLIIGFACFHGIISFLK